MGDKPGPSIIDRTYKLMGELDVRRWAILTAGPFDCRLHLQTARGIQWATMDDSIRGPFDCRSHLHSRVAMLDARNGVRVRNVPSQRDC
jgi:hypothetical protein